MDGNVVMTERNVIQELAERIATLYQPDKIILFGSHARGDATEESDIDLLVVLPFAGNSFRKSIEILNAVLAPFPHLSVDLLARRPDDTARRYSEGDPLIREAIERGYVLYERHG